MSLRRSACAGPARPNRNGTIKHCWKCPGRGFRRHWRLNVGRSISDAKLPLSPVLPPRRPARVHCQATSIMILAPRCISTRSRNLRLPLRRQKPLQTILAREPTLGRRKKLPAGKSEPTPHPSVHHRPQSSSSSRFTAPLRAAKATSTSRTRALVVCAPAPSPAMRLAARACLRARP